MIIMDAARVIVFAVFLLATLRFFWLSWQTRNTHPNDVIVQQHFAEHAIAGGFAFIGALVGLLYSIPHLFSPYQGHLNEIPFTVATLFLLLSGIGFMLHMIKEQTPGHAFYVRENGE